MDKKVIPYWVSCSNYTNVFSGKLEADPRRLRAMMTNQLTWASGKDKREAVIGVRRQTSKWWPFPMDVESGRLVTARGYTHSISSQKRGLWMCRRGRVCIIIVLKIGLNLLARYVHVEGQMLGEVEKVKAKFDYPLKMPLMYYRIK